MAGSRIFIDTNVLVYATIPASPFHQQAIKALHEVAIAGTAAWISRQVIREYLVQITRPGILPISSAMATALSQIHALEKFYHVADETAQVTGHLLQLLQTTPISGKQVHDANIVATMQAYGIDRLLTNNQSDFARFSSLIVVEGL